MNFAKQTIMSLTLPKCGMKRNVIENYDIERSRHDEEKYIKILNTPLYQWEKEVVKLRQENKEIVGYHEALEKLLKCHPFPRYQGPFHNTMTDRMYESMTPEEDQYTFQSYTTFLHEDSQPCYVWKIKQKSKDKLKLHLVCDTHPIVIDHTLSGPASLGDMAIMYTCQKSNCVIVCPCMICCNVAPACKRRCGSDPCPQCNAQCTDHHLDLPRKYNQDVHSFTIPCYSQTFGPTRIQPSSAITSCSDGHRYAGIPRSCDKCRLDLLDHQIHHHVLHDRCKFCKVELRKLDKEVNVKLYRNVAEIKQTDNRTCGFCYKVFTRIKTRKLHEKLVHGSCDERVTPKCEIALDYHKMQTHALKETKYKCEICALQFKSETSLKRHIVGKHESQDCNNCELCTSKFKRKDKLTRHMKDVHNATNINHHYSLNSNLPMHLQNPYKCKVCGKRFKRKETLKRHEKLETCHQNEILKCQQCGEKMKSKKTLKQHTMLFHMAAEPKRCEDCDINFVRKAHLLRHEENVHNKNGLINCENCNKSFSRRDNMLRHMKYCKPVQ